MTRLKFTKIADKMYRTADGRYTLLAHPWRTA